MSVSTPDAPAAKKAAAEPAADVERSYTMLEERTVADMLRAAVEQMQEVATSEVDVADLIAHFDTKVVFEPLGARPARNAEHAHRLVFKERFGEGEGEPLRLAAVSEKMWKPKSVGSKIRRNITVG
jgi:hypothetical protein